MWTGGLLKSGIFYYKKSLYNFFVLLHNSCWIKNIIIILYLSKYLGTSVDKSGIIERIL